MSLQNSWGKSWNWVKARRVGCTHLLDNNWANMTGQSYWWVRHWFVISHTVTQFLKLGTNMYKFLHTTCILCIQLQEDHLRSWETNIYIYIYIYIDIYTFAPTSLPISFSLPKPPSFPFFARKWIVTDFFNMMVEFNKCEMVCAKRV